MMQMLKKLYLYGLINVLVFGVGLSSSAWSQTASNLKSDLSYIPSSTLFAISLNPAELSAKKESKPLIELLNSFTKDAFQGVKTEQLGNVVVMILPTSVYRRQSNVVIRLSPTSEADVDSIKNLVTKANLQIAQPDPKTLLLSKSDVALYHCQLAGVNGAKNCSWAEIWNAGSARDVVFMAAPSLALTSSIEVKDFFQGLKDADPRRFIHSNSLEYCEWVVGTVAVQDEVQVTLLAQAVNGKYAESLVGDSRSVLSMLRGIIFQSQDALLVDSEAVKNPIVKYLHELESMLEDTKIAQSNAQVRFSMISKNGLTARLASMSGSSSKAIANAPSRRRSANTLKQLGLAMLNYESAYKRLPAAMQIGPMDVPRSWRVTLLPYLEKTALFEKYQMAESWDSPANAEILKQMPEVFGDPATSETGFRVFISPVKAAGGALFSSEPAKSGPKFAEITDGTSNTICIVESVNTVPWTKPEGILFDPSGEPLQVSDINPKGFNVVFVDCSVRFIPPNIAPEILKGIISKNGGEAIFTGNLKEAR